jgi:hypothetical protein
MRLFALAVGIAIAAIAVRPATAADQTVEVMVLGTYHMSNPGLDVNNTRADDVLTARRQQELAALILALAEFKPTKILIETQAPGPTFVDAGYTKFTPAQLNTNANEITQVAYRLAHHLGHSQVFGIDEQPGPGEPDYFPFGPLQQFLASTGQTSELERMNEPIRAEIARFEAMQRESSVAQLLAHMNAPNSLYSKIGPFYYESLRFGDGERQPGADLNGGWYLRNAKIFAKLTHVATAGDRVIVIFGAGHNYWLRHFTSETPGFVLVEPGPYLERANR